MFPLFPQSSLDSSILTSVLVGLCVVWFFQETFGWNFTGLVVPGYLASVLVIQPATGAVITVEAFLTWWTVLLVSQRVPSWWPWTPLFGRDRFFLFLLVSVALRIALEGGGLEQAAARLGVSIDAGLHSMGLVVVPLAANALWRAGAAGVPRIAVPVLVTWAILELVLLRHTNLSLTRFELTYEDLALDFVSSPRAYVLLLVGAAFGSWANLRWGWDFGGLIVPGLLALCWVEPARLVATMAESTLIAGALLLLLRLPALRGANLTGGRPLVLAFITGYVVKFTIGWLVGGLWPGFAIRDLFGFGYLLSSIVALRMVKHGEVLRALVPALVTSLAGFVSATSLGYLLALAWPAPPAGPGRAPAAAVATLPCEGADCAARAHLLAAWGPGNPQPLPLAGPRELLVVGRAGPLALAEATVAVAEALGARAVLVCAPDQDPCDGGDSGLPVLRVEAAERSELRFGPALAPRLDLAALGEVVGDYTLGSGTDAARLALDVPARVRAAARRFGAEPPELTRAPPPGPAAVPDEAVRAMQEAVLRPLLAWRGGAPWGEEALRLAAGRAEALGAGLTRGDEAARLLGEGWGVSVDRAARTVIVDVPDQDEPGAPELGEALAWRLDAAVRVERAGGRPGEPPGPPQRYAHAALLVALESLGDGVRVVSARGMPRRADPGADVVLSLGRPLDAGQPGPPLYARLRRELGESGLDVGLYDGGPAELAFADAANAARAPTVAATGEERQVTVFATVEAARRLAAAAPLEEEP